MPTTPSNEWGGRPIARSIAQATPRQRLITSGRIISTAMVTLGDSHGLRCVLDDGSGRIGLVFVGRDHIPGFGAGAPCSVEGTVRAVRSRLELWNPLYRFTSPTPEGGFTPL